MATEAAKDAIASEIAYGMAPAQVARTHGYTQEGLRRLLRTPDMEALVREKREILAIKGQQLAARNWLAADQALSNIIAIASDQTHRRQYDACTYLVDKVMPTKQVSEQSVQVTLDAELSARIMDGIQEMRKVRSPEAETPLEEDPHLHEGADTSLYELPEELTQPNGDGERVQPGPDDTDGATDAQ